MAWREREKERERERERVRDKRQKEKGKLWIRRRPDKMERRHTKICWYYQAKNSKRLTELGKAFVQWWTYKG